MTCISRVGVHGASQAASKKVLTAAIAHQSNPFANQVNILTVTVEANFDIPALSHLIVRNLRGIQERRRHPRCLFEPGEAGVTVRTS